MKKAIILIFSSVLSIIIYSQNYHPIIGEDKTWNVLSVGVNPPPPWDTTFFTISYKLSGDTIINSVTYKKMYSSLEEIPINWNLVCFMREDANRKVWLKDNFWEDEFLMYDFSINEGDSIQVGFPEPVYLYVDSITSVTVNGTLRPKYCMSCKIMPDYRETWIEGIGSNKGIISSGSAFIVGGWSWLLCMSEGGELIYMNPNYNSCYLISTDIIEKNNSIIQVYPNPAKDKLILNLGHDGNYEEIKLINSQGVVVLHEDLLDCHDNFFIDISKLPKGFYLYMLTTSQKLTLSGKIVIK